MPYPCGLTLTDGGRAIIRPPRSPGSLLKTLDGTCSYPDGSEGTWAYERLGPACHRFTHRYGDGSPMPRQYVTKPLANDPAGIGQKARELAPAAFLEAVEKERKERFARVSLEPGEKPNPLLYQVKPAEAKELGGRYALCVRVGVRYLRTGGTFATLAEAAEAWKARRGSGCVVCCLHRRHRRWEKPKYNPLLAEADYPKEVLA